MLSYETTAGPAAPVAPAASTWRSAAIAAYRRAERECGADLATRIAALTGRRVDTDALVIDRDARRATVLVEGTLFQMQDHALVLLRPCVHCGVGPFPSPAIASVSDLGYALAGWEPRCADCGPEDPS